MPPVMATFRGVKLEADPYTTPPASSPECAPLSPLNQIHSRVSFSQIPNALGLINMSNVQQTTVLTPASPPTTESWTTQAETLTSASLAQCSHLSAEWDPTAFTTTPLAWNSPAAYSHDLSDQHHAYSAFPAGLEHGLHSHQSPISSYSTTSYGAIPSTSISQSSYQVPQGSYGHEQSFTMISYAEVYGADYTTLASPHQHIPAVSPYPSEPAPLSTGTSEVAHQLQSPQSSVTPEPSDPSQLEALAQVARVRTRRRAPSPSSARLSCPECGYKFGRTFNYKEHLKVHNPDRERPFPCPIEGCQQQPFNRMNDLTRHLNSSKHANKRDYNCPHCPSSFTRRDTLRRHVEDGCQRGRKRSRAVRSVSKCNLPLRARP